MGYETSEQKQEVRRKKKYSRSYRKGHKRDKNSRG